MRLIDAEKFEVFDATCQITKWIRSGKTAAYFYGEGCRKVLEAIDAAPTIDPESLRPTAHWGGEATRYVDGVLVYDVWHCSKCGYTIDDGTDNENELPNYCPHCGALMEGRTDE